MPVARQSSSVLAKVASGGGASYGIPSGWTQTTYGPGWPISPVQAPRDVELPRTIDYPMAVNTSLIPRTGYGLMPFAALNAAYEAVTECKMPVSLIARELMSFVPHLVDADGNEVGDHDYRWMCEAPDRKTPFNVWLTRLLKSSKVYDAAAVYLHRDGAGKIDAIHYIDGSTLFVIVDEYGNIPAPEPVRDYVARSAQQGISQRSTPVPSGASTPLSSLREFIDKYATRQRSGLSVPDKIPAFTQVIKGAPFAWWSADDIWYMPQSRRLDAPYGESFIEQAWAWIMVIVNLTAFELGHYRTGNMPEGFVTVPKDLFPNTTKILAAEEMFNARMTSNPATERNRLRIFPDGSKYFATKKPDFPRDLYRQAWNNVLHTIGIPPSEFGDIPGGGLGGKGFKEGAASDLSRNTLNPHRQFIAGLFNYVLERDGVDDVTFALDYPLDEIDPDKQKQSVYEGMAHGTLSLNDARGQLNLEPIGDPEDPANIANKHLIVAGSAIYVVEDMQTQSGAALPTFSPGGNAGGEPVGPEAAVERDGQEHTPEDLKTLREAIRHIQDSGTLDGKHISVPSGKAVSTKVNFVAKADATHSDGAMVAVMIPVEAARQLRNITESLGLPDTANLELPENMHVTLAFLPDAEAAQTQRSVILDSMISLASGMTAMQGKIQGFGVFNGKDGMKVLFALLDEPQLPFLRTAICKALDEARVPYGKDYGFVPHITMAYFPERFELPAGFEVPNIPAVIDCVTLAFGSDRTDVPFAAISKRANPAKCMDCNAAPTKDVLWANGHGRAWFCDKHFTAWEAQHKDDIEWVHDVAGGKVDLDKVAQSDTLQKHCGVCPEDDDYFGAPISREVEFTFPNTNHANGVEIVAMCPDGLPPKAALWKAEGGEVEGLQEWIGGPQYLREEAAYIVDRSLGFYLVPVAYCAESYGEHGAAVMYSFDAQPALAPDEYAPEWIERAAVLDCVLCQQDRGYKHNMLTHPDEPGRPILFDNGLCLPADGEGYCSSPFVDMMNGKPLSQPTLVALTLCLGDASCWSDVAQLVGKPAAEGAKGRVRQMLADKCCLALDMSSVNDTNGSGGL